MSVDAEETRDLVRQVVASTYFTAGQVAEAIDLATAQHPAVSSGHLGAVLDFAASVTALYGGNLGRAVLAVMKEEERMAARAGQTNAPAPQLEVADNPEVGRFYGPDGRLLRVVRARPDRPVGFRPQRREG